MTAAVAAGRRLAFGAGAVGGVNLLKAGLQFVMLPLMAHLLSPAEFGLYALALPAVSLLSMLADGGLGASLAREPDAAPVWSTAFWALAAGGAVLAIGLAGWGFAFGAVIHQRRLPALMAFLSLSLVFLTLSVCPTARLTRQGRLAVGAGADLVGNLVGAGAGVLLAVAHAGAFSLAAQYVTTYAVRAVLLNLAAFHRPRFELRPALLRDHLGTSFSLVGSRLVDFAGRMLENTVFGLTLGTASLGLYTFANQLPRFVCEAVGNPVWSALYVLALRGDAKAAAALHAQLCRLLGLILFPAAALIAAAAPDLIVHVLGRRWAMAAPLVQLLLPSYVLATIGSQSGAILLACGRFDIQFLCGAGMSVCRVLAVCAAPWVGLLGAGAGVAASNVLYAVAMLVLPARISGCTPGPILRALAGPLAASVLAGAAAFGILHRFRQGPETLLLGLAAGGFAYLLGILLIDRAYLRKDWHAARLLVRRGPKSPVELEPV